MKKVLAVVTLWLIGFAGPVRAADVDERLNKLEERLGLIEKSQGPKAMNAYWDRGLKIDSVDQRFQMSIGGRILWDTAFISGDKALKSGFARTKENNQLPDGTQFRTIRLETEGVMYRKVEFSLSVELSDENNKLKDAYIGLLDLPYVGNLRVGFFKEPFSLEELTSIKYITFMERSLANAFSPGRNTGIMLQNNVLNKRATWAIGTFVETDDHGKSQFNGRGQYSAVTGRLTGLPYYEDEGKLIHLGVGYSIRKSTNVGYDTKPEVDLVKKFIDTGNMLTTGDTQLVGAELAALWGSLSLQGEINEVKIDRASGLSSLNLYGFYGETSYFLTGERKNYKRGSAKFGGIDPKKNFGDDDGGWGAWEVAARYSQINIQDENIVNQAITVPNKHDGKMSDVTLALNWYLNPLTVFKMNYVYSDLTNVGIARAFQTRVQVSF